MLLAQLTDLHIKPRGRLAYRQVDTAACLEAAVADVRALTVRPDLVLVTGDLTDAGQPEEYGLLRELLSPLGLALFVIPGNHDDRPAMCRAFADQPHLGDGQEPACYVIEEFPVRVVMLDSLVPGESHGTLGAAQLAWLERTLSAAPERPTIVSVHHPPFLTGIGHMDRIGLRDRDEFATIIQRHAQVERVLAGHVHRSIQARWAGTLASTAPSTAHQVALDLRDEAPSRFRLEPAGYQLHRFTPATGVVSHTAVVGNWPGPFPFFADGVLID